MVKLTAYFKIKLNMKALHLNRHPRERGDPWAVEIVTIVGLPRSRE